MSRPGDKDRPYTPSDYRTNRDIRNVAYDRLRSHGVAPERAREVADRSVDKLLRASDANAGGNRVTAPIRQANEPNRLRVPFPWEASE